MHDLLDYCLLGSFGFSSDAEVLGLAVLALIRQLLRFIIVQSVGGAQSSGLLDRFIIAFNAIILVIVHFHFVLVFIRILFVDIHD